MGGGAAFGAAMRPGWSIARMGVGAYPFLFAAFADFSHIIFWSGWKLTDKDFADAIKGFMWPSSKP